MIRWVERDGRLTGVVYRAHQSIREEAETYQLTGVTNGLDISLSLEIPQSDETIHLHGVIVEDALFTFLQDSQGRITEATWSRSTIDEYRAAVEELVASQ